MTRAQIGLGVVLLLLLAFPVFAGAYALYCGVVFIATAGLIIAPVGMHMLHKFHLDRSN